MLLLRDHGNDDNLRGRDTRRQDEAVVVRVRHDERADEPGTDAPARGPRVFLAAFAREILDARGLREILPEEVGRAGLHRLAVLHHRLDAVGLNCARKTLAGALAAADHRHGEMLAREGLVDVEHFACFLLRLRFGLVRGVAFLPEKLGRAQENAGAHFPPHHVGPLVQQQWQVAIRLHPFRVGCADDRLRGGPHDERLGQPSRRHQLALGVHLQPVMRHDRAFLGEAGHVLGLLFEIAERDEKREVGVLVPRHLEHLIELRLHQFPDAVAPRLDDHAAAHFRIFGEIGRRNHGLVPFGEIVRAARADGGGRCLGRILGHKIQLFAPRAVRTSFTTPMITGSIETSAMAGMMRCRLCWARAPRR